MFYLRFLKWLFGKADYWGVKLDWGDVGLYNKFDATTSGLARFFRLIIGFVFIVPFIFAIVYPPSLLPISKGYQALVSFGVFAALFVVFAIALVKSAKK